MNDELTTPHPRESERLIGHSNVVQMLDAQLAGGRPHHAWLLNGRRGIGKATFAYSAAKSILTGAAFDPQIGEPDKKLGHFHHPSDHPIAGQVSKGAASSLYVYERRADPRTGKLRSQIDVDLVRDIGARFHLHTADGGWRVAIIDCLNDLNPSSANALLKLLEEPPKKSLFLLINHTGGFVLPTIRSRCLALQFNPLSEEQLLEVVAPLADGVQEDDLGLIQRLAAGSAGRALELLSAGGAALYREMLENLSTLPARDDEKLHRLATKLAKGRDSAEYLTFTSLLTDWLAKIANMAARRGTADDAAFIPDEAAILARLIETAGVDRWSALWEKTVDLFHRADLRNLDRKQTLLDAFHGFRQTLQT
jgi:DNA polymerase-3 subunit delta'